MVSSHRGSSEEASKVGRFATRSELIKEESAQEMMTDLSSLTAMQREITHKEETTETIGTTVKVVAQASRVNVPTETEMTEKRTVIREDQETDKIEASDTLTVAKRKGFQEWTIIKTSIMQKRMPLPISSNQVVQ